VPRKFRMDLLKLAGHGGSKGQIKEIDKPFHASQIVTVL